MFRVGFGFDSHRLVKNRPLILGGVKIPYTLGLDGHSDADVLIHAVMDAILGALGKGDIGIHFPDTDNAFKNADSLMLLEKVFALAERKNYGISNLDATVVAEKPKLSPFVRDMRINLARILKTEGERINIKATTTEGMGHCGKGEGIDAYAVVSLINKEFKKGDDTIGNKVL